MPFGGKPLPDDQIDTIRRWIREGAKDDSPADSRPRRARRSRRLPRAARHHRHRHLARRPDRRGLRLSRNPAAQDLGGGLIARLPGLSERIHSLVFTPDGKTLAAVGGNPARFGEVQIWDVASRKQKHSVVVSNDTLFGASLSPDGTQARLRLRR